MLKAKTATISGSIDSIKYNAHEVTVNDDARNPVEGKTSATTQMIIKTSGQEVGIVIRGTAGAGGVLVVSAKESTSFKPISQEFTLTSSGTYRTTIKIPSVTVASQYNVIITPGTGISLGSSIPTAENPDILYQYLKTTLSVQLSQTGSSFTIPSAAQVTVAPAFTSYATSSDVVIGTKTDYHRTVPQNKQEGVRLHAFEFTVPSADASKVSIDSSIGTTEGYVKDVEPTNTDTSTNGGTSASVRELNAREVGNDVVFYGYVAVKKIGNESKTIEIPIDDLIST